MKAMNLEATKNTKKVLVVDDDPVSAAVVRAVLRFAGYDVSTSQNPEEAIRLAEDLQPDLIITDFMMPGLDGNEFCTILKSQPATRQTPVLFLSGAAEKEDQELGYFCGAAGYLDKTISHARLAQTVRRILGSQAARD